MILSWIITGSFNAGLQIGFADVAIKMILYYLHERAWYRSSIGNSIQRHLLKTITWRVLGTATTVLLAYVIWGDGILSVQIGGAETITKSLLYYVHERLWYRINFGLDKLKNSRKDEAST